MKKLVFSFLVLLFFSVGTPLLGLDLKASYDAGSDCWWPCNEWGGPCVEVANSCETHGGGACGPGTGQPPCQ